MNVVVKHQFGLKEWADLCEQKDATIAALQARGQELIAEIAAIRKVESQAELSEAAHRETVKECTKEEAIEFVYFYMNKLTQRTAELEAIKADTKNMLDVATSRLREQVNDLQAELERVRGELAETKEVEVALSSKVAEYEIELNGDPQNFYGRGRTVGLRTLIAALPKVEGEINERFCTGSYYSSPHDYRSHVTFETALVALLKHRQGMEG